jgi:hypothetical protein
MRAFVSFAAVISGCEERIVFVDPPIELEVRADAGGGGDPRLILGIFREQFFTPLQSGGSLPIIAGFQGGDWVMPAIRAVALAGAVDADATVTTADGEVVGILENAQDRLQPTADGLAEIVGLPIPIRHAAPRASDPIDDLYGKMARLDLSLTDNGGTSASERLEVQLVED